MLLGPYSTISCVADTLDATYTLLRQLRILPNLIKVEKFDERRRSQLRRALGRILHIYAFYQKLRLLPPREI